MRRHWRKTATLVLVTASGIAYAASPLVREKTHVAWHAALAWAGVGGESVDTGKVFWCPMHPQIKSKRENAVCPICNMALVELAGGIVESPQHLSLTAQQVQQAGVVTEPVMRGKLYREIDTTGRIDYVEGILALNDVRTDHGHAGTNSGTLRISDTLGRGAMSIGHIKPSLQ